MKDDWTRHAWPPGEKDMAHPGAIWVYQDGWGMNHVYVNACSGDEYRAVWVLVDSWPMPYEKVLDCLRLMLRPMDERRPMPQAEYSGEWA